MDMKVIKKIIKILAVIGMIAGAVKLVLKVLNMNQRMNDYNEKAVFGGKSIKYEEEPFEKDSIAAMFSGYNLDFKAAKMANAVSQLDILARFSGVSVKVPDHWNVEMDGTAVQSGISKRYVDNSEVEDAPTLKINYDLKFSGLDVSNPSEELEEEVEVEDLEVNSEMSEETKKVIEEFEESFNQDEPVLEEEEILEEVVEENESIEIEDVEEDI
jgi:hypothetical protein